MRTQSTAFFCLVRNAGSSIGISTVIFLLSRTTQVAHAGLAEGFTTFSANLRWPGAHLFDPCTHAGRLLADAEVTRQATTCAYVDDFWLMMIASLAALPLVAILRRPGAQPKAPAAAMD